MRLPAILFALCVAATARGDVDAARDHYNRGNAYFEMHRFLDAAEEFEKAYRAKEDPAFLYNVAQAYRQAGALDQSIAFYRAYLKRVPRAANRVEVEGKVRELQALSEQQRRAQSSPPKETLSVANIGRPDDAGREPATPAPGALAARVAPAPTVAAPEARLDLTPRRDLPRPGRAKRIAGLTVGALGLAALGAGIGLAVESRALSDRFTAGGVQFDPAADARGRTFQDAGIALLVVGGAAIATGVVVFLLGHREARQLRLAFHF